MEEKEIKEFSLPALFLTTGFCFLSFTLFLGIIGDVNIKIFMWTGLITFILGLLTIATLLIKKECRTLKTNPADYTVSPDTKY